MSDQKTQNFINKIKVNDVFLRNSLGSVEKGFNQARINSADLVFFKKHIIASSEIIPAPQSDELALLQVLIQFGIRIANKDSEEKIKGSIEADFVVEYIVNQDLSREEIDQFVFDHASDHAWPYWLEFLNSQLKRMRLPAFSLPAFEPPSNKIENT